MKIVLDSNIVFSALLSKDNISKLILTSGRLEIYSCNFLFLEIFKHKEKLQRLSNLDDDQLLNQFENILSCITFIKEESIPANIFRDAYDLCRNIDEKDTPFVALALFTGSALLTGDKILSEALKQKGFSVISISEIQKIF